MRVEYKRIRHPYYDKPDDDRYKFTYKKVGDYKPCCDGMEQALDKGLIGFGEAEGTLNTLPSMAIYQSRWESIYEEPIEFCPFCGEKITCTRVMRVTMRKIEFTEMKVVSKEEEVPDPEE
jgi:hypothetical protein